MERSFLIVPAVVISSKVDLFLPSVSLKMEENIFSLWCTFILRNVKIFVWFTVKYKTLRVVCEAFVLKISHWLMLHGWVDQLKSWQQWNQNIKIIDITWVILKRCKSRAEKNHLYQLSYVDRFHEREKK